MKTITLPDDLEQLLTEEANRRGTSLESLIRDAIDISKTRPDTESIQKLRETLRKHLGGRTRVPVQVELVDGRKFVIDSMQQYKIDGSVLMIGRRNRILEIEYIRLDIASVVRVTPLDELPNETGGMSYRDFHERVNQLLKGHPFLPFEIQLIDGRTFIVERDDQLRISGRYGNYIPTIDPKIVGFRIADVENMQLSGVTAQ